MQATNMTKIAKLDRNMQIKKAAANLAWHDVRRWGLEGKGWDDTEEYFDRLPRAARKIVRPPVWELSRMSAGMAVRFKTNADAISARYELTNPNQVFAHMPPTAHSGADLYGRDHAGQWRWVGIARPATSPVEVTIISGLDGNSREYMLYLPLYNGVKRLEIGVPAGSSFKGLRPRAARPLVFYGTSILQGGCASRPGMVWTSILGRWFDMPTVNLGFSGNGKMDLEMARLLSRLDARIYVLDCLPNMQAQDVPERAEKFIRILRRARRRTPILLVEDRTFANAPFVAVRRQRQASLRRALQEVYGKLLAAGMTNLYYATGADLFGGDGEATVDGSHATDLGFYRQARALQPVLSGILADTPALNMGAGLGV